MVIPDTVSVRKRKLSSGRGKKWGTEVVLEFMLPPISDVSKKMKM